MSAPQRIRARNHMAEILRISTLLSFFPPPFLLNLSSTLLGAICFPFSNSPPSPLIVYLIMAGYIMLNSVFCVHRWVWQLFVSTFCCTESHCKYSSFKASSAFRYTIFEGESKTDNENPDLTLCFS